MLDNNFLYLGLEGLHSMVQSFERNENCNVCGIRVNNICVNENILFREFYQMLKSKFDLISPTIYDGKNLVYISSQNSMEESLRYRMEKTLK